MSVKAGFPQGLILEPLFSILNVNGLSENAISNVRRVADDTSLFYILHEPKISSQELKRLQHIAKWALTLKMSLNLGINKQVKEIIVSKNNLKLSILKYFYNSTPPVSWFSVYKHLSIFLDEKLNFQHHLQETNLKASFGINFINNDQNALNNPDVAKSSL